MAVTRVVIGSCGRRDYSFLLPLTAMLWKKLIGLDPFLMLVGDWEEKERNRTALSALRYLEIEHVMIGTMPEYPEATLAQNCREHAAVYPFPEDTWLMCSDADLWPIRKEWYYKHETSSKSLALYYSNGDHYSTFPTCHMTAQAKTWRQIMGYKEGDELVPTIKKNLDTWLQTYQAKYPKWDRNFAIWMSDQAMASDRIREWPGFPHDVAQYERVGHPPVDRIDRCQWPAGALDVRDKVDAHIIRPADVQEAWPRVRELFSKLLPKWAQWAEDYRNRYVAGY